MVNYQLKEAQHKAKIAALQKEHQKDMDLVTEALREARDLIARQQVRFDEALRRSEQMRNRQVDVINRLQEGEPVSEQMTDLLRENAVLTVRCADLEAEIDRIRKELGK